MFFIVFVMGTIGMTLAYYHFSTTKKDYSRFIKKNPKTKDIFAITTGMIIA